MAAPVSFLISTPRGTSPPVRIRDGGWTFSSGAVTTVHHSRSVPDHGERDQARRDPQPTSIATWRLGTRSGGQGRESRGFRRSEGSSTGTQGSVGVRDRGGSLGSWSTGRCSSGTPQSGRHGLGGGSAGCGPPPGEKWAWTREGIGSCASRRSGIRLFPSARW